MINLSSGHSEKDRISFYTSNDGATAIREKNGEIRIEYGKRKLENSHLIAYFICFILPLIIKYFVLLPEIEAKEIESIWYLVPTFFFLFLALFSIFSVRKNNNEFLKNHAAEHMVFSAYKKFKRVPTVEETLSFSRINRHCGIGIYSGLITCQLIGFFVFLYNGYVIPEILLFLFSVFFYNFFPLNILGKFAQFFTTKKPEKANIELAIAALTALEKHKSFSELFRDALDNVLNEQSKNF